MNRSTTCARSIAIALAAGGAVMTAAATATAVATDAPSRTLVHQAVIDAPVQDVWWAFTTAEGFSMWAAPKVEVDFRIGGEIRSSYNVESNLADEHAIVNRILSYEPQRMLSIQNVQAPSGFKHAELFHQTWSVIEFEPLNEQQTRVHMTGHNYGYGPAWDVVHAHFEQGNAYVLQRLQQVMAARSAEPAKDDHAHVETPRASLKPVECDVLISATREQVWQAWTTDEGIQLFFAPDSKVELTISGPFEMYFAPEAPEGQRGSEGCRILTYSPQRMLSFSWNAPPSLPNARQHHTWIVLWLDDDAAAADADSPSSPRTRVRLKQMGFAELAAAHPEHAAEFEQARDYFNRVWPHVLTSLQRHFDRER